MATLSSNLARIILWTKEPGGLHSIGPQSQILMSIHMTSDVMCMHVSSVMSNSL